MKETLENIVDEFLKAIGKVRTDQAAGDLFDDISVNVNGSKSKIKHLALSTMNNRRIEIQPWDKSNLSHIAKALSQNELNVSFQVGEESIAIDLPQLTQDRREELAKLVTGYAEEYKVRARKYRANAIKECGEANLSKDSLTRAKAVVEKDVAAAVKSIDELAKNKVKVIRG